MDAGGIMQIVGQVIKIGGAVGGAIASKRAERRMRHRQDAIMNDMKKKEQADFDRRYYADATATADTQRILSMQQQYLKNRREELSGQQALGMGTGENLAMQKAADNETVANATSTIAANAAEKKDALADQHQAFQQNYSGMKLNQNQQHFQNRKQQIANGVKIAQDTGDSVSDLGKQFSSGGFSFGK